MLVAILDIGKSLSIAFIPKYSPKVIPAQGFASYFHKMAANGHLDFLIFAKKKMGFFHSGSSMAVSNMNLIWALVSQLQVS